MELMFIVVSRQKKGSRGGEIRIGGAVYTNICILKFIFEKMWLYPNIFWQQTKFVILGLIRYSILIS